jgi:hypothetical protein
MNKRFLILLLIIALAINGFAQFEQDKPSFKDRLFYGGGFGLTFGSVTHIDVSPLVGYRITDRFSAGIGLSYQYYKYSAYNIKTSIYGGKVFASFTIVKDLGNIIPLGNNMGGLMLHAEAEALNLEKRVFYLSSDTDRVWVFSPLAGVGYSLPIGNRSFLNIYLLYNFNEGQNSPYDNPVFRISLQF